MSEPVRIVVNGRDHRVQAGMSVASALLSLGVAARRSVSGEPRAPVCGMGVCMECRVTVDGRAHVRGCQTQVREGMEITSDA